MASEGDGDSKRPISFKLGKKTDEALGDVIRALLLRPAEVSGDLLADSIGILGDRVKLKRQINAHRGLERVRLILDEEGVDMKDITPPEEEELYLLVDGMSLANDETVRELWARLFAKSLQPGSNTTAERSFISVLESLSPMDAKVVDLMAFVTINDWELEKALASYRREAFNHSTLKELEQERKPYMAKLEEMQTEAAEKFKIGRTATAWAQVSPRAGQTI